MNQKKENLKRLLSPQHIAFIGSKEIIENAIRNCRIMGFHGKTLAIHPKETTVEGVSCYPSVSELPYTPDAAFIAVRNENTISVVRELSMLGTSGCVCYAAGFSEIGGEELQDKLIQAAGNMALVGPNCYGILNYVDKSTLWPDRFGGTPVSRGAAIISQSGNISLNLTMTDRSLPLSYVISAGNQAVLGIGDYIDALCDDPRVSVIGLHIEGLSDVANFSKAAQQAFEKGVPLVALKTGTSDVGTQLTLSHTSSLAGSDELYQALFERLNISRVDSLASFAETLKLFSVVGPLQGKNLGILAGSGGESAIAADIIAEKKLNLPELNADQVSKLREQMDEFVNLSNPLDYNTAIWGNVPELKKCFTTMMSGDYDATLLILDLLASNIGDTWGWQASMEGLIEAKKENGSPAIVVSTFPEGIPKNSREKLIEHGIAPLQGVWEAFTAIKCVSDYGRKLRISQQQKVSHDALLLPDKQLSLDTSVVLNEWESKSVLSSFGLPTPKGQLVSAADAPNVAEEMGDPLVVKAVSSHIAHKTEMGAVVLNLRNAESVSGAVNQIYSNLPDTIPENEKLFLIEEMVGNSVAELTVGLKRDPQFGLALVVGTGGELVNLLNDSAIILLPANRSAILEALYSLKGIQLMEGYRGRSKGDIDAVVQAIDAVASYAYAYRNDILELDVNPLIVLPEGEGAIAADALIRLQDKQQHTIA